MVVLLDLEWIEKGARHLTQLSAVRTDEKWNPVASLEIFVKPAAACVKEPEHMAFGGVGAELYRQAFPERECLLDFDEWLEAEDEIWVWARSNRQYLTDLWHEHLPGRQVPKAQVTAGKVRELFPRGRKEAVSPYALLARFGEAPPYPEHRASNDTEVMRRLFSRLGLTPTAFARTPPKMPMPRPTQRERNLLVVERTGYNFVYLKSSEVFHKRACKAYLSAKSEGDILGSVYYETAAKGRRACKLCNPEPLTADGEQAEKARAKEARETAEAARPAASGEIIRAKLLTGETIPIKRRNILGWCHNKLHKGAVNRALLEQHDCLGKSCPYLERNRESSFWDNLAAQQAARAARREQLREEKRQQAAEEERLIRLLESWQSCLDGMESDMYIVRIVRDAPSVYRIFYVSDNRFADGNRYPAFLEALKSLHPQYRIILRHIRDVDGHFVTYDEYMNRAGKQHRRG